MSTAIAKNFQVGADGTASNNFTIFQPATPDGTLRIGNGNTGITSSLLALTSGGNFGIGTSSPAARLDIAGSTGNIQVAATGNIIRYTRNGANYLSASGASATIVYECDNHAFYNGAGTTERMRIDSSGNLGLGVTPSAWGSTYKAFDLNTFGGVAATTGGMRVLGNTYFNGTSWIYKTTAEATRYDQASGIHSWYTAPSGTAGAAISFTQAMTLDAGGNLGIGTSSPGARLEVLDSVATTYSGGSWTPLTGVSAKIANTSATSDTTATLVLSPATPSGTNRDAYISAVSVSGQFAPVIAFGQRTDTATYTERARIDSSGHLLVGTPSFINGNDGSTDGVTISRNGRLVASANQDRALELRRRTTDGNIAQLYRNTTLVGSISVTTSATSYNTSSDYRLKDNIAPMTGALAKVAALKPCTYKWKADGSDGEGFIAHELAEVVPQCVTGEKDAVDAEGNPVYQGIDTSFLVATLTAAIQEQQAIIEQLKADVAALKGTA